MFLCFPLLPSLLACLSSVYTWSYIGLSFVDAHQQREQSISVANPVGSLSWYPHLVCVSLSLYVLFDYGTLWNIYLETFWIFLLFFHSEFCPLVYFMWFVHRLFGTTHWASWYAIYTNCLTSVCHSTSSIHMLYTVFAILCYSYNSSCNLENTQLEGTS